MEANNSTTILKRYLLEIRQLTLRLIEDALEAEYRLQVADDVNPKNQKSKVGTKAITTYKDIEIKEQTHLLKNMITDADYLYKIDNIRSMLPKDFPHYRNPFMLGKSVDQLADLLPPHAEPGNEALQLI